MRALLLLLASPAAFAAIPVGVEIEDAVVADVTKPGFDAIGQAVVGLVPEYFAIPPVHLYDEGGCVFGFCAYTYQVDATDGYATISPGNVTFAPGAGVLSLNAGLTVAVNAPSSPLDLYVKATGIGIPISSSCDVWVDPFPVTVGISVELGYANGEVVVNAGQPQINYSGLTGNHIKVSGCAVDTIETVLDFFGWSLYDFVLDQVKPEIDKAIQNADLPGMIEDLVTDAFGEFSEISDTVDLLGAPLDYSISLSSIQITNNGMRASLSGSFDTIRDPCIDRYGYDGSVETPSTLPSIGTAPGGAHLAVYADDDFVNNALFAVWSSGLLCFDIDDDSDLDLPLAINTNLLSLLASDHFDHLFPTVAPMRILTRPEKPPEVVVGAGNDVNLLVDPLGLEFYAELDGRQVRLVNLDLTVDAGVDLTYTNGILGIDVALDGGRISPNATFSDLVPEAAPAVEASFSSLFDQLAGPLLGDALGGLSFPVPTFEGIGLAYLDTAPAASADDRLGVYAKVGTGLPDTGGCGCDGADAEGCDTGCTTGGLPARGLPLLLPFLLAMRRRRS